MANVRQSLAYIYGLLAFVEFTCSSPFSSPLELRRFALEDLVPPRSEFYPLRLSGQWISETDYIFMDPGRGIKNYNAETNVIVNYLTESDLIYLNNSVAGFSKEGQFLLVTTDKKKVYRWSSTARYFVYELESKSIWPVGHGQQIQTCTWSGGPRPTLAFVRENNVYYVSDVTDPQSARALTTDGVPGEVYNGVADWIYEEEILNSADAMWFSTEGSYLAVATFNDTQVESATYPYYGSPGKIEFQYPKIIKFKYPKAGRTNPSVSLKVFSLKDLPKSAIIHAPVDIVGLDHILGSVSWASDQNVVVLWLNRRQNISVLINCDLENDNCETIRTQKEPNGWIDISLPVFDDSGTRMVDVQPMSSYDQRYPHVIRMDHGSALIEDLSPGNVTVLSILGWNMGNDRVYFLAAPRDAPWERQVWASGDGNVRCVSCAEPVCKTVSATFAPGAAYAVFVCSATNIPPVTFIYDAQKDQLTQWRNNSALSQTLSWYALPAAANSIIELFPGVVAHVRLMLPSEFNPASRYPMVVKVYAGPGSARVLEKYELDYSTYLASNRSFVVAYVDVRGSGVMGMEALHAVNNALGTVEVDDTLLAISHLVKRHSFIDPTRVGVWGWSYGGYTSALMLAHDAEHVLKCAAAIAPVTSWLYYDSIYTERYMDLPLNNRAGYESSDLLLQAKKLKGRQLLLVHGSADDNVHYQHSMLLAKHLQHADIAFQQMSYPDENHSLQGVSRHFYHMLDHYWSECFYSIPNGV